MDRSVNFKVQSKDVLHDFWVPAFRMKIDAVPGIDTGYRVTPTRLGSYPVVCAELCGLGHSVMRQTATVLTAGEVRGLARPSRPRPPATSDAGRRRPRRRRRRRQGALHAAEPAAAPATRSPTPGDRRAIGPNLDESLEGKDAAVHPRGRSSSPAPRSTEGFGQGIMPPNYGQTLEPERARRAGGVPCEATKG